jgi:uncharacterized damage-inducible protein DinB
MKPIEIRTLFDYNDWAFERIWDCITHLSDEQFTEEIDYSTGSIRNIVVHMMSATQRWINRLQETEAAPHLSFEEFDTLIKTKTKWDEMSLMALDYVYSLSPKDLDETIHWDLPARGLQLDNHRWEILLHVANHATDHRAQILTLLHQHFHVETVEQDLLFYLVERSQK